MSIKHLNIPFVIIFLWTLQCKAQTELFFENFNQAPFSFTLNTTDVASTGTGENQWIRNNAYTGGSGTGDLICPGIPFPLPVPVNIANTPFQPAGIQGGPQSFYIHTLSNLAQNAGFSNASFLAADGTCVLPENIFARMSNDISTVNFSDVQLSFWWTGFGGNDSFGEVYYSTNGGTTWTLITTPITNYNFNSNWLQQTIALPAFDNQNTLRFGFRFVNNIASDATDPGFSIDDVRIVGTPLTNNTIITGAVPTGPHCPGATFAVPFTIDGSFLGSNVFTAQLSDAAGSFATPIAIGTLNGNSQGTINITIPLGTPAGTGYRIRVIGSNPSTIGTDNGVNITIISLPDPGSISATANAVCINGTTTLNSTGATGTIQWQQSSNGINYTDIGGATAASYTTQPITQATFFRAIITNQCGSVESNAIQINIENAIQINITMNPTSGSLCTGEVTLTVTGNFANFTWSNGATGNSIIVTTPGEYCGEGLDVSGCPVIANCVTVSPANPQPINITPAGDVIICNGTLTLTATPGFASYEWSNGGTNSSVVITNPGTYTVTGVDVNGCSSTSTPVNAEIGNTVVLNVNPANPAICNGQPIVLTAAPGFSSYQWSNGQTGASITVSQPIVLTVNGVDPGGCNGVSAPISVVAGQLPVSNFNYMQPGGFTANFSNTSQNANNFSWDFDGLGTSAAQNPSFTFPSAGIYSVKLGSSNVCGDDDVTKIVSISAVSIKELDNILQVALFPNPVTDGLLYLSFEFANQGTLVTDIFNLAGQQVVSRTINGNGQVIEQFDFSGLPSGLYLIRLVSGKSVSYSKIIKR